MNGTMHMGTSWVIFSGNPDQKYDYDNTYETLIKQSEQQPGFIRLLSEEQELELKNEAKLREMEE